MQGVETISALIEQIKRGELILPEFQRGYVWKLDQVKSYILSMYRGYPTGHFLIWKTYKPQVARGKLQSSDSSFSRLILDGQQRLTTVYAMFEGKPPAFYEGEDLYFDLYFNLLEEDFQFFQKSKMANHAYWLGVTPFLKKGIHQFLDEIDSLPPETKTLYSSQLKKFNKLDGIRNYAYHLDEVSDKPVDEIVRIFNLVNSNGTPLNKADLALARVCAYWPEARETLRRAREGFEKAGFSFELEFLTRCISSVAVGNIYFEGGFDKAEPDTIKDAWSSTSKTLEYLVNVLRNDAYIDSSENLNTPYVLIPLVVYLTRRGGFFQQDVEKKGFLHWMYAALMWGRYSGSMESNMQADLNSLSSEDPVSELLSNIVRDRGRIKVEPQDLEGKGTNSSFYTLTYVTARSRGAIDWFTGMNLYSRNLGKSFGLEDHHIFPQSVLYKNGYDPNEPKQKQKVNEIANRAFLTKKANLRASNALPTNYLPPVKANYPTSLRDQFIPANTSLWEVDRYEDFLAERRKLIAAAVNQFLDSLISEAPQTETPDQSLKRLLSRGESEDVEFKSSLRWDYKENRKNKNLEGVIAKSASGLMNAKGGTILIGIGPNKEVLGLQNDYATLQNDQNRDGFEQKLMHILMRRLGKDAATLAHVSFVEVDDKDVCWLRVEPTPKPAYVEDEGDVKFYVRIGNTTQPMNAKELTDYVPKRWA
jgi:hypothetical protein